MSQSGENPSDALKEVLSTKKFAIGREEFLFADVPDAAKAIREGFVPSPLEYDVYDMSAIVPERPLGDTRVQPTAHMERRPEYENPRVAPKLDEKYGVGNWKLVGLRPVDDSNGEAVSLKLMLKEDIAKEKFGTSG